MSEQNCDLFVIGAGSGGVRAARQAAARGARVVIAEAARYGGTCVNLGCVPKKLLTYAARTAEEIADARGFGWRVTGVTFDWGALLRNVAAEVARLNAVYRRLLDESGVERVEGRARFVGERTLAVSERRYRAERVLVAVGGVPFRPCIPGAEQAIVSDDVFSLPAQPRRIVIVGGGYIAVELAGVFCALGSEVTLVHRRAAPLTSFDPEVGAVMAEEMALRGVRLILSEEVGEIVRPREGDPPRAVLLDGREIEADQVLLATGRLPATGDLGLELAGVRVDGRGAVEVDPYSRTSAPGVYAIGDCTERLNLTPVAIAEAMAFARTAFDDEPTRPDYALVPTCVFGRPEVGTVGLTEPEARARCGAVDVYHKRFRPLRHTVSGRKERVFMKVIVARGTDRVVGVHVVGPDAGEIVQGFAVALRAGVTKAVLDATVGIHPTIAEDLVTMRDRAPDPTAGG